ncbi:hypothetical protein QQS21_003373 [Conoideocrella luteorostrata]|uniref:Clr5 domain-containing protein n=1 Tax=Conoideocrella luteorostrata TaxID=1105319 RepID=A0AAJ0CTC8_9HYPO|nr:hypothetical protein QQS21_003373 [Conoideocrella luteorostrata]
MTRHRHGEEEWEQLRLTISDLSTEENKTSQQIVEILEKDHGFKTGIRKLKEKMMDWGLTKYIKKADMKILISKKEQRQSLGKETIFFHHGEQLSDKRLITFSKRSSTKDSPVPPHDAPTPPEVTYHTPAAADVAISHNCHNDTATLSPERTPVSRALQKRTLNELPDSSLTSNGQISQST